MEFRVLGPLEVIADGKSLDLGGPKQRALLAVLLMQPNRVVSSDSLIDALWEGDPPATARKALQIHVSQLRKSLGKDRLETKTPGYLVRVDPGELDLDRFRRLRGEGKLDEALSLWRGPALADFAYERFAQAEIGRLDELRLRALEEWIERGLAQGRHAELVGELEALVRKHPLSERFRAQLMLALYRSGRQAAALEAYQAARRALVDELGIEPGRPLRDLQQAIFDQDPSLDLAAPSEEAAASSGFVGRQPELAELLAALADALRGRGRLILLAGEPGIGKSRLAEEVIARARASGAGVLVGRCWEAGGAPAYWPWVQSLRAYVRESDAAALRVQLGSGAAGLAQIVPELRERFPDLPKPPALESEGARFHLFDATAEFLRNASQRRPLVLFLDDLHAADTPSLLLLRFIARGLGSARVLVLGAYRDVDPAPTQPLSELLAEVAREPVTRRLSLVGLSQPEVAEYVERSASQIASPELTAALSEETEGNPLFVSETVRLLSVEGVGSEARLALPQSVRDVIARRLTHLSEECRGVLSLASVIGREFGLDALARLSGLPEDRLLDALDEAMSARVVSDVPGGRGDLRFAHVLIRDVLYDGLTGVRRIRLHRQVVEAFEALYGEDPGPHLAELAHHALAGSELDEGLRYGQRAGDRAMALLAYEEAARLYETALEALERAGRSDERTRCALLLALGEAEVRAGEVPAAKRAFLDAADVARRLGLNQELARAAAGYGGRFMWARAAGDDRLVPLLEEGLGALADDEVELRVRLLARLAGVLRDEHSRERRDRLSSQAVELARRSGNPAALAYALDGRTAAISAPDTVEECLALATELGAVAERIGDIERAANALDHRRTAQVLAGDLAGAAADLEAESRIADDLRQPFEVWQVQSSRAMFALAEGRLSDAEKLIPDAFALGEHAQPAVAIPVYRLQWYTLCDFRGHPEEAEPAIRDLVAEYPTRPTFRCALAHVHARMGQLAEAQRELDELASDDFSGLPFDQEWLYGMSLLAETSVLLGDTDRSAVLYRLLAPWAALNAGDHPEGIRGSVARYVGMMATATQHWVDAERQFERAVAVNGAMGVWPWLAHTRSDYAEMLLARDRPGDRKRARGLLAAAVAGYRDLGMESYVARDSVIRSR